jgi:surface antigen
MKKALFLIALALTACSEAPKKVLNTDAESLGFMTAVFGARQGEQIGAKLDDAARRHVFINQNKALEFSVSNKPLAWQNVNGAVIGEVTVKPVVTQVQSTCREYEHIIKIDGKSNLLKGKACRNNDGSWKHVS